ncbi:hypothetical protein KR51_00017180, partial [Rubidibacter lacunae KORDI 51-2]
SLLGRSQNLRALLPDAAPVAEKTDLLIQMACLLTAGATPGLLEQGQD